jgi:predicted phage baseplate assembly protein
MPLTAPKLDDRSFEQIVAEAKTLIPRYTPEWTDHNESDPGITLIQLFAWMTEMLLYRLNQVPELNYVKFLQLIGVELKPAQPARAELTFKLKDERVESVDIPKGTQVAAAAADGPPVVFETNEGFTAIAVRLGALQTYDGQAYELVTQQNVAPGQYFRPFGATPERGVALLLGFEPPQPELVADFPTGVVDLAVEISTEGLKPEGRHCDLDVSLLPPPAALAWEYWDPDRRLWRALALDVDETKAFSRSGHIALRVPTGETVRRAIVGAASDRPRYWIRARIEESSYELAPRVAAIRTNTVPATQAVTIRDEILGGSTGRPNQTLQLANRPVVALPQPVEVPRIEGGPWDDVAEVRSVRVAVNETGDTFEIWQEVGDFFDSGAGDAHFVVNRTTGEIRFGDGTNGRIPVANPDNPNDNIVAREYRFGGGLRGNVGADKITELQTSVEAVESVTNVGPAAGGSEEETLEEAKLRAPREIKHKERAVTAEDFEALAIDTPGARVRRAKALPLTHPSFGPVRIPGVVTVVVVPESESPRPLPSDETLAAVCAHLNKHRLLTTEVHIVPPVYRKVRVHADVIVRPDADSAVVKRTVEQRLADYFHALRGGENGTGWEFGREIFHSQVYRTILDVDGVDRIVDTEESHLVLWLDEEEQPFCLDVPIGVGELLWSDAHDVQTSYRRTM